ncbi:MAG: ribosome maturation factor RimM, partial [Candidatus Eisenbacteria bacterium]|nr:ribosome maturation factor RimM [Candidatus Eisenbacteria bacterium]
MAEAPRRVQVGRILKAHGVRGEVVVSATGNDPGRLQPGLEVFLDVAGTDSLRVEASRWIERGWLVRFEGRPDRDAVEELAGVSLYLEIDRLPPLPEGEYYQFQLEGLAVRTAGGEVLGRIEQVLDLPGGDVYEVQGPAGIWLIPGRREFIECVDLERGELRLTDRGDLLEAQRLSPGSGGASAAGPPAAGRQGAGPELSLIHISE